MSRTDLSERQWRQLESHLPGDPHRGLVYVDYRWVLNGILWRLKTGAPIRYGPWQTCYDRFVRWSRDGTWQHILKLLQAKADASGQIDWDGAALDSRLTSRRTVVPQERARSLPRRKKGGRKQRVVGTIARWPDQQDPFMRRWQFPSPLTGRDGVSVRRCQPVDQCARCHRRPAHGSGTAEKAAA